jgi:hypothetical protein
MGNGLEYTLGEGHGASRSSRLDDAAIGRGSAGQAGNGSRTSASRLLRGEHPNVEAMLRTVAAGAGRAGEEPERRDEELAVIV